MSLMGQIDKWGRDQPIPIALILLAREINFNSKAVHELLKEIWTFSKQHPLPQLEQFSESLQFYKKVTLD